MSLFYQQPGLKCPKHPPRVPIPENHDGNLVSTAPMPPKPAGAGPHQGWRRLPWYMGETFPHLCRFWSIVHEVSLVYYAGGQLPLGSRGYLPFAEFKFRELLAWSNGLPAQLAQRDQGPHHVQVLQQVSPWCAPGGRAAANPRGQPPRSLWFHAAILDIFRPCIKESPMSRLRTFSQADSSPESVYAASVAQMKRLIFDYRFRYQSSSYSILWHKALIYVANDILDSAVDEN